jgi:hypothetical protein
VDADKRRDPVTGLLVPADPPEVHFEVRLAAGADGRRLAREQARVIKEVVEWLARRRSEHGSSRAA